MSRDGRRARSAGAATAAALLQALNEIAPLRYAPDWDNVGLLAGRGEWRVRRVLLAIDLTDAVAREALDGRFDAVLAYHPPIFKGIRRVTPDGEGPTTLLADLLAQRVSVLAVHTALDLAVGGTNDVLLDRFDPVSRRPLEPLVEQGPTYKLVVFVPPQQADGLRAALSAAGAGVIGHYSECSFGLRGAGTFRGDETTRPTVGRRQTLETVDELRMEMVVPRGRLADVVRALYASHSYEEPAFDLYPLHELPRRGSMGWGRVGSLRRPRTGHELIAMIREQVDLSVAVVVGDLSRSFASVTVAVGSPGVGNLRDPASLVLLGECKHHDALQLVRRGVTAVCLGHDRSERAGLRALAERLAQRLAGVAFVQARSDVPVAQPLPGFRSQSGNRRAAARPPRRSAL